MSLTSYRAAPPRVTTLPIAPSLQPSEATRSDIGAPPDTRASARQADLRTKPLPASCPSRLPSRLCPRSRCGAQRRPYTSFLADVNPLWQCGAQARRAPSTRPSRVHRPSWPSSSSPRGTNSRIAARSRRGGVLALAPSEQLPNGFAHCHVGISRQRNIQEPWPRSGAVGAADSVPHVPETRAGRTGARARLPRADAQSLSIWAWRAVALSKRRSGRM